MTALVYREDEGRHVTVVDEDDGCPVGNHQRDELCARTRLPQPQEPDDKRGDAT